MTLTIERPLVTPAATEAGPATESSYRKRRMYRIFAPDGNALVVAMDGARRGVAQGLTDPVKAVQRVVEGGADAILTTQGMARATVDALRGRGLIIGLDGLRPGGPADFGVEQALRLGADAVELKVFPLNPQETLLEDLRQLSAVCDEWGMPLLGEPIPVSFENTEAHTMPNVATAARLAAECGADFVKAHYVGTPEEYAERVVAECYVPLLCLGGPAKGDPVDALRACANIMKAGGRGIVFGRNIVTAERPDKMCAALGEIIHGGATADAAAKQLRSQF